MTIPILSTKLHIPISRPALLPRPRLIDRIIAGLHGELTLISAPAGSGKTTLLSEWIARTKPTVAWLSLDQADNDPNRFLAHLIAALQTLHTEIGEDVLGALDIGQFPAVQALLTDLINEIAALTDAWNLILDDYHEISEAIIHEMLEFILDHQPSQMHMIVSTRGDPPWPLARMRARGVLNEIRAQDLRFTRDECTSFLTDLMGLNLSSDDLEALDERTEGWIAGLHMAALAMQGRTDLTRYVKAFSGSQRFIMDYLMEEVLDRQSAGIREFLIKTSILDRMSAGLCDHVTENEQSQEILEQIDKSNLFLIPLDDKREWYRYHHLFIDLLRSRREALEPGLQPHLHNRASEWFEREGLADEAIQHAIAAEDLVRAATLIEQQAILALQQNREVTLSRWLQALPEALVRERPWLCFHQAYIHHWIGLRGDVEPWLGLAEKAMAGTSADVDDGLSRPTLTKAERERISGFIAVLRGHNALTAGDIPRVVEMSHLAEEYLTEEEPMRMAANIALGGAYWAQGDVHAAERAFASAMEASRLAGIRLTTASSACYVGMQKAKQAQLNEAAEIYRQALELAVRPDGRRMPVAGFPSVRLGDLYREWNDLPAAQRYLDDGLKLCLRCGQVDILADSYVAMARLQLALGEFAAAADMLQKAEHIIKSSQVDPWIACWMEECRLRLMLATGDLSGAIQRVQRSGLTVDGELSYHCDLHHINLARMLIEQDGQGRTGPYLEDALGLLARLLEAAEQAGWIHEVIKILILNSLALQALDRPDEALDDMSRALNLAEPGGYVRMFIDEGVRIRKLLMGAPSHGAMPAYSTRLLRELDNHRLPISSSAERGTSTLAEPLTRRELQVLRLMAAGLTSREISEELYIAISTTRTHIKNIYGKLDVHSRYKAVDRAKEYGLI